MNPANSSLEIRLHLEDGRVAKFSQNDAAAISRILDHVQPSKLFNQPYISISGDNALTLFHCDTIVRIDFIADNLPRWPHPHGVTDVREISQEEFRARNQPPAAPPQLPGATVVVYSEIETVSGHIVFLEVHVNREPVLAIDQSVRLQQIFSGGGPHLGRREGGISVMNAAKIARQAFYSSPVPPAGAWHAHRVPA